MSDDPAIENHLFNDQPELLEPLLKGKSPDDLQTILQHAIICEAPNCVEALLKKGIKPEGDTWVVTPPLEEVCEDIMGSENPQATDRILELLLTHHNFPQEELDYALWTLPPKGSPTKEEKLLKAGANPNAKKARLLKETLEETPSPEKEEKINALLKEVNPNCIPWERALTNACIENHPCAITLLKMGVKPQGDGDYSYRCALSHQNKALQNALRKAGASTEGTNEEAACQAAQKNDHDMVQFNLGMCHDPKESAYVTLLRCLPQANKKLIELLVTKEGADLQGTSLTSPLIKAVRHNNQEAIQTLLDLGAKPTPATIANLIAMCLGNNDTTTAQTLLNLHGKPLSKDDIHAIPILSNHQGEEKTEATVQWMETLFDKHRTQN